MTLKTNFVNLKFSASTNDTDSEVNMSDVENEVNNAEHERLSSAEMSTLSEGRDNADLFEARQPNFPSEQVNTFLPRENWSDPLTLKQSP